MFPSRPRPPLADPPDASMRDTADVSDTAAIVLTALVRMSSRSRRGQADLAAALAGAAVTIDPTVLRAAIKLLVVQKCIAPPIALDDGGAIVPVLRQTMPCRNPPALLVVLPAPAAFPWRPS